MPRPASPMSVPRAPVAIPRFPPIFLDHQPMFVPPYLMNMAVPGERVVDKISVNKRQLNIAAEVALIVMEK